jgi:hypothetical protein
MSSGKSEGASPGVSELRQLSELVEGPWDFYLPDLEKARAAWIETWSPSEDRVRALDEFLQDVRSQGFSDQTLIQSNHSAHASYGALPEVAVIFTVDPQKRMVYVMKITDKREYQDESS